MSLHETIDGDFARPAIVGYVAFCSALTVLILFVGSLAGLAYAKLVRLDLHVVFDNLSILVPFVGAAELAMVALSSVYAVLHVGRRRHARIFADPATR